MKNLFGNDFYAFVDEGPVQEGYIHVEFPNIPYRFVFNPHLDGWKSLSQAEIEVMISDLAITYICVFSEDAILLLPDYPYTNCESYNSLLSKGTVFSYEEDQPLKIVEFKSNGVMFSYQWNGTDSADTLTHTVFLYPII